MNKEKWQAMDNKQKLSYYRNYYLLPTVIVIVVLILLINLLLDFTVRRKVSLLNCTVFDLQLNDGSDEEISNEFLAYEAGFSDISLELFSKHRTISISSLSSEDATAYSTAQTKIAAGAIDIMFVSEDMLDYYSKDDIYADLNDTMYSDILDLFEDDDNKIYMNYVDSTYGTEYLAAIDITDTSFAQNYFAQGQTIYMVGIANGENINRLADFGECFLKD